MQKNLVSLAAALSLFTILLFGAAPIHAQFAAELRPFDFTDKTYEENGIFGPTLVDRKNGADNESVIDQGADSRFRNVRITATLPAYTGEGEPVFWNYYGGATKESFTPTIDGSIAADIAYHFPMYVFPSTSVRKGDRQAAMIRIGPSYYEKNFLGIAAVFIVEYAPVISTKMDQFYLQQLAKRNGVSVDGTPIIRTARELEDLLSRGLITIRAGGSDADRTQFAVAKVLRSPELGAIAPDAFLIYAKEEDGDPLAAEAHFLSRFQCYQTTGLCS